MISNIAYLSRHSSGPLPATLPVTSNLLIFVSFLPPPFPLSFLAVLRKRTVLMLLPSLPFIQYQLYHPLDWKHLTAFKKAASQLPHTLSSRTITIVDWHHGATTALSIVCHQRQTFKSRTASLWRSLTQATSRDTLPPFCIRSDYLFLFFRKKKVLRR